MASSKETVFVLIFLACTLAYAADQCHCATSSACSGYPDVTCTSCQPFWSGPTCQKQNIARGDVHSTRASDRSDNSDRVVDGEKSGHPDRCTSISDESGTQASWSLILNHTHEIHGMKIYYQRDHRDDLGQFEVRINAALCKSWPQNATIPSVLDITCDRPLTGDLVSISIPLSSVIFKTLALCEVEIYVCGDHWYGDNCDNRCNCAVTTEVCDKRDGNCVSGTRATTLETTTTTRSTTTTTTTTTTPKTTTPSDGDGSGDGSIPDEVSTLPSSSGANTLSADPQGSSTTPEVGDDPTRKSAPTANTFSLGEIAGVVIGAVVVVAVITAVIVLIIIKKRPRNKGLLKKEPKIVFQPDIPYINEGYASCDDLRKSENTYETLPCDKTEEKDVYERTGGVYEKFGNRDAENQYNVIGIGREFSDDYDHPTNY